MEKTNWKQLDPTLRAELEALLKAPTDAFLSDFLDAVAWWGLILLACVFGAGASIWTIATDQMTLGEMGELLSIDPMQILLQAHNVGLIVAVIVGVVVTLKIVGSVGRRGYAALDSALVVVRGPKLKVLHYRDVASAERRVMGQRGAKFTVLSLKLNDGRTEELSVTGTWAGEVVKRLERRA